MSASNSHQPMPKGRFAGLLAALVILLLGFGVSATGDINTGGVIILAGAVIGIMFKALRF